MVYEHFYNNVGGEIKPMPEDGVGIKAAKMSAVVSENSDIEGAKKKFEKDYLVVIHGNLIFELIPKGFSKAEGIKLILENIGIDKKDTYAFGDSMNDYEMLDFVEYGIAMGNSDKRLFEATTYVTDTIENDGIYKALLKYQLI